MKSLQIAVVTALAWTGGATASSSGQNCQDLISGRLTATPSVIDRDTSADLRTTLAWSVTVPPNCPVSLRLSLAGRTVGRTGKLVLEVTSTTTYKLLILLLPGARTLASATVTVRADPGFITVSAGKQITPEDLAKFNGRWMQPNQRLAALSYAEGALKWRFDAGAWGTGEHMVAMSRMYELTRDRRYLDHLCELIKLALRFRDDQHPGFQDPVTQEVFPANPLDEIRGRNGLPAWGGRSGNSGGLHRVDEVTSSNYAYPIAAFARIVAEDETLHTRYGLDAMLSANAVLQTVWLFMPQIRYGKARSFLEAWLTLPENYQHTPTEANCKNEYDRLVAADPSNEPRWKGMLTSCRSLHKMAGRPVAHNENLAFAMVLIELSRVLESRYYRLSPLASADAEPARALIPLLVSRQQRYFVNRLHPLTPRPTICGALVASFCWHYSDELPPGIDYRAEDTSHGSLDMRYLELLRRDFDRLNVRPASVGEPIAMTDQFLRGFANTFLHVIAAGTHFKKGVAGGTPSQEDSLNGLCDGWVSLAAADLNVYHRCHDVTLRIVNGKQPYLGIGNHSALLMNKRFLPEPPGILTGTGLKRQGHVQGRSRSHHGASR